MDDQNQPQPTNKPLVPPNPQPTVSPQPVVPQQTATDASPASVVAAEPIATQPVTSPEPVASPPQGAPPTEPPAQQPSVPMQEPRKKKKALKIILIVVGVVVALLIILVIIGSFIKPDLTLTEYKNTEFNYSIQRPVKWEEETKTSVGGKTTLFTDKIKGEKNLYRAYMEISATTQKYPTLVSNSDELFDQVQSSIKTELSGFAPTTTDNTDFKGNKARRLEGTYKSGSEVGRAIVLIVIESDGQAEAVLLATPEKSFDKYEKTFNEIIESFNP
jgi:hypothetical protein